jgi:ribonuclease HI
MGVVLYTDGACRGNPGPGGCAAIIDDGHKKTELSRGYRWTTNNRMEIRSVIVALETLGAGVPVKLVSDSQYVLNALSKGWIAGWKRKNWISTTREPVKNRDLWERLDGLVAKHPMTFEWVRGHASHPLNNRCDEMAVAAALGSALAVDSEYEAGNPFPASAPVVVTNATPAHAPLVSPACVSQTEFPGFL